MDFLVERKQKSTSKLINGLSFVYFFFTIFEMLFILFRVEKEDDEVRDSRTAWSAHRTARSHDRPALVCGSLDEVFQDNIKDSHGRPVYIYLLLLSGYILYLTLGGIGVFQILYQIGTTNSL